MNTIQKFRLIILLFLVYCSSGLSAQGFVIRGHVFDATTHEALAFVNILANNGPNGASTDIDGKFILKSAVPVNSLKLSYVGYESQVYNVNTKLKDQQIRLVKKEMELPEVVIKPGINPAHRIIRHVLENRLINDHEKMEGFTYRTYEKTIFGPEHDSIPFAEFMKADTNFMEMKKFFDKQHLFLMESVTERKFKAPDKNYNNVIASRVSGFGDPLFVFLMGQLQSTSFYKETIKIVDKEYINPISVGTFSKYYFEIQDTLVEPYPYDTTYIISFRPFMKTNFDGLKGVISISTNNFAIRNVIAEPNQVNTSMTIKIQQLYDFVQNEHWFPLQLNTDIIFKGAIGKGTISVGVGSGAADSAKQDLIGRGKSYISNINLNPNLKRSEFGFVEVDVQPDAYHKPQEVWNQYRVDSLTTKDLNTYHVIDSLGKASNFDKLGRNLDAMLNSKVPIGPFDLELDKIVSYNHYEGFRLGAGIHTNYKFSNVLVLGGYGAYGFKEKNVNYGGNLNLVLDRFHETSLGLFLQDDVKEAGGNDPFEKSTNLISSSRYRQLLIRRMDQVNMQQVTIGSRVLNYAKAELGFKTSVYDPKYDYKFVSVSSEGLSDTATRFKTTGITLAVRYAYGEKFIKGTHSLVSLGTTYPVLSLYIEHNMKGIASGQYDFNRYIFNVTKTLSFKYLGKTAISLWAGYVDKDVPYPFLFTGISSYAGFSLYSPGSFSTMRMGEFVSDEYAALFLSHSFGKLLYRSKHFNPQPELVTNIGYGSLRKKVNVEGNEIKTMEKGYFESGLVINGLLNLYLSKIGVGAFYRYGPYAFPDWKDNVALKMTLTFILN
ncbi:MAG: carboxypeptidase-like regulatory domain-containing protein [Bacteroidetes bacterium]|nr:carboxypeptidase-like regulatory domain-containing protein [Bacteroidota bacterium]